MTFALPTTTKYSESVCRTVMMFHTGQYQQISRWSVVGKVKVIVEALKEALVYEPWMEEYLYSLDELAKESL